MRIIFEGLKNKHYFYIIFGKGVAGKINCRIHSKKQTP